MRNIFSIVDFNMYKNEISFFVNKFFILSVC